MPDETDRVLVLRPIGARPTVWPDADFIVGNPPFIAGRDLRAELGSGYAVALWKAYPKVPKSADIALHFWWKGAQALNGARPRGRPAGGAKARAPIAARRFGFITSNSLRQVSCRRVVADAMEAKPPLHLVFAIPDHPWTDGKGAAAVRIAMTVAERGPGNGVLSTVTDEAAGARWCAECAANVRRRADQFRPDHRHRCEGGKTTPGKRTASQPRGQTARCGLSRHAQRSPCARVGEDKRP